MIYDKDIREPLFDYLETYYGKVRVLEEKTIGRSRADVFLVRPECICGVEIKSDADSYVRLATQVKDYDRFFDENIVVVGTSHAQHIEEHVPDYWGIVTVEDTDAGLDFYMLRKPTAGKTKTNWVRKLGLLWRPELAKMLEQFALPKYREKSKEFVVRNIAGRIGDKLPEDKVRTAYCDLLFERDYAAIGEIIETYKKEHSTKVESLTKPRRRTTKKRYRRKRIG